MEKSNSSEKLRMNKVLSIHILKYLRLYELKWKKYLSIFLSQPYLWVFSVDIDGYLKPMYLFTYLVVYFNFYNIPIEPFLWAAPSLSSGNTASDGATDHC